MFTTPRNPMKYRPNRTLSSESNTVDAIRHQTGRFAASAPGAIGVNRSTPAGPLLLHTTSDVMKVSTARLMAGRAGWY